MESPYDGPIDIQELTIGDTSLQIALPADPDRLLECPDVLDRNQRDDYMPYWAYLWPSAFLLAEAVMSENWEAPGARDVLEIGCGLGLGGLAALRRGFRHVHFTDYDRAPLRFVSRSLELNGISPQRFSVGLLDWRDVPERLYPVILGSDVLYERHLVPLVVNLLKEMLAPGGLALLTGPYRQATEDLAPLLDRSSLRLEARPITALDQAGHRVEGTVQRVMKPHL